MKYLTVRDLMRRYMILARSTITFWVRTGKLPRCDKIGELGRHEWSEKLITDWERTHGGNTEMFRVFLRSHDITFDSFLARNPDYAKIIKSPQEDNDSRQIEFSEPLSPEVNSDNGDSAVRVDGIIRKLLADSPAAQQENNGLAASEADNHNSNIDYDVREKITQANKNVAALSSRVIAFMNELAILRGSVHTLIKIVSILTNAQRNSSGLLYGQLKAALIPLTALEKEFSTDNSPVQTEDSEDSDE